MTSNQLLLERRNRVFGAGSPLFYEEPLELVRGEGVFLFDRQGRRYVDLYNNVPCVGHANPRVVEAVTRAQSTLNVHSRYLSEDIVRFAERYLALHGEAQENVIFSCSGTEANELALQMARLATGRQGILCCASAYHGNSTLVSQLTDVKPEPSSGNDVRAFPVPDPYRSSLGLDATADVYIEKALAVLESFKRGRVGLAAILICPIFANEGTPNIPDSFLQQLVQEVRRAGGLVIADEVQAGYGRIGQWWGYEKVGIQPDIVVTGKPMGNGVPLAATAASAELVQRFRASTQYFNTCASSPLQAAAGLAVLDEIEQRGLIAQVAAVGAFLLAELRARLGRWSVIGEVRGHGLFINIEIVQASSGREPNAAAARQIIEALLREGFLSFTNGPFGNQVKIRPPLVFDEPQAREFLEAFDRVMNNLRA